MRYFEEQKNNSKKNWDGIRSIIIRLDLYSHRTNSHKQIKSININNKTESNPKIMTETFNNFFVKIARDKDSKIIHTNTNYKDYLQDSVLNSFFLNPATDKSTGPDSILVQILKISNQIIWKPLTYLINLSFSNRIFPDLLKTSNVIPVFKRGKKQDYNNYRPMSLISNPSKLMENIVLPRLNSFLEKNFLLFERQYGFVTAHTLIMLLLI